VAGDALAGVGSRLVYPLSSCCMGNFTRNVLQLHLVHLPHSDVAQSASPYCWIMESLTIYICHCLTLILTGFKYDLFLIGCAPYMCHTFMNHLPGPLIFLAYKLIRCLGRCLTSQTHNSTWMPISSHWHFMVLGCFAFLLGYAPYFYGSMLLWSV
jgi:hypothetical protein